MITLSGWVTGKMCRGAPGVENVGPSAAEMCVGFAAPSIWACDRPAAEIQGSMRWLSHAGT